MVLTAPEGHTILVHGETIYVDGNIIPATSATGVPGELESGEYREFVPGILKATRQPDNDPDYKTPGMKLRIKTGDAVEVSTWNWDTVHMPTGYLTNVRVQLPGGIAPEDGLCTAPTTSPLDECKAKCDAEPTYAKVTKGVSCEQAGYHTIWDGPRCEAGTRALGLWDPTMKYTGTHFLPWHRGFVASPPGCNARINPLEEHSVFVNTNEKPIGSASKGYDTGPIGVAECSPNYPCICDTGAHPRLCTPRAPFEGCTTFEVCDPAVDCGCTPNGDGSIISATATTNSCQQRHDEGYMPPLEYCKCTIRLGLDGNTVNEYERGSRAASPSTTTMVPGRRIVPCTTTALVEGVVAGGYPSCAEQCEVSFGGSPRVSSMPIATPTAVPLGGWVTTVLSELYGKCLAPHKCATASCTDDLCADGAARRPIGDDCCGCPADTCANEVCTMDVCWDGMGRREIGDECCACPPPLPDYVPVNSAAEACARTSTDLGRAKAMCLSRYQQAMVTPAQLERCAFDYCVVGSDALVGAQEDVMNIDDGSLEPPTCDAGYNVVPTKGLPGAVILRGDGAKVATDTEKTMVFPAVHTVEVLRARRRSTRAREPGVGVPDRQEPLRAPAQGVLSSIVGATVKGMVEDFVYQASQAATVVDSLAAFEAMPSDIFWSLNPVCDDAEQYGGAPAPCHEDHAGPYCTGNDKELCFYDVTCRNGGLGCNAAGYSVCRFCGFKLDGDGDGTYEADYTSVKCPRDTDAPGIAVPVEVDGTCRALVHEQPVGHVLLRRDLRVSDPRQHRLPPRRLPQLPRVRPRRRRRVGRPRGDARVPVGRPVVARRGRARLRHARQPPRRRDREGGVDGDGRGAGVRDDGARHGGGRDRQGGHRRLRRQGRDEGVRRQGGLRAAHPGQGRGAPPPAGGGPAGADRGPLRRRRRRAGGRYGCGRGGGRRQAQRPVGARRRARLRRARDGERRRRAHDGGDGGDGEGGDGERHRRRRAARGHPGRRRGRARHAARRRPRRRAGGGDGAARRPGGASPPPPVPTAAGDDDDDGDEGDDTMSVVVTAEITAGVLVGIIIGAVACCVVGCIMTIVVAKKTGASAVVAQPEFVVRRRRVAGSKGEPALVTGNSKI